MDSCCWRAVEYCRVVFRYSILCPENSSPKSKILNSPDDALATVRNELQTISYKEVKLQST